MKKETNQYYILAIQFLEEAQKLFGDKIDGWNFYGIEIEEKGPNIKYYPQTGHVVIVLSDKITKDNVHLVYQLSHEVCHLLHPSRNYHTSEKYITSVFNEGLATHFQFHILGNYIDTKPYIENLRINYPNYYSAYELVRKLILINKEIVKELRILEPRIDLVRQEHFEELNINVPKNISGELIKPFKN